METSAGVILQYRKKILVCHPTNSSIFGTWSIPKGHIESGEELLEAAIRETLEETGIRLNLNNIDPDPIVIDYKGKNNRVYKQIHCFHYIIQDLSEINLDSELVPHQQLQLDEVDMATFMDLNNLETYMFWRLKPILQIINGAS